MKIYLAGPDVFEPDAIEGGRRLKAMCAEHGAEGLFPMDNEILDGGDLPGRIRAANMEMIRQCDAIVANMKPFRGPSMDVGTAYEMGVGAALGKIIVGYSPDPRSYATRMVEDHEAKVGQDKIIRDLHGLSVEDFGMPLVDNLMMACGVDCLCVTVKEAIREAVRRIKLRDGVPGSQLHQD
jgi:nucleoside 2-deoxyribosyltransferase